MKALNNDFLLIITLKHSFINSSTSNKYAMTRNWTIKRLILPSKTERPINKITNKQNTKRTHGQQSDQLFPKRLPLSNPNRIKNNINKHKKHMVKRHQNSDAKSRQHRSIWTSFFERVHNSFAKVREFMVSDDFLNSYTKSS